MEDKKMPIEDKKAQLAEENKTAYDKALSLKTFWLPSGKTIEEGNLGDQRLGRALVAAWQTDGILQLAMDGRQRAIEKKAMEADRQFVKLPLEQKKQFVSELSYSGYIGSKEEETDGKPDAAEIFTITKDVPMEDARVQANWPCHGPVCWPNDQYRQAISAFMAMLGEMGEKVLKLVAIGLGLPINTFTKLTADGWHHMRVLHFPDQKESSTDRGIGSHTDYGMLVLATQVKEKHKKPPAIGKYNSNSPTGY
jgi:isopenicillin N synthase-like dioxygenase